MRTHFAAPALVAVGLTAAATLSVTAQNQAIATTPPSMASTATVTRAAARVKADAFTTIQGNALTSTNGPLNDITVRLRDARYGRIVGSQTTDKSGLFEFKSIDPGAYIVEVMANDQSAVLAASQLLNINSGEAVSAVVKLPFRIPPFAGIMGSTTMPSAAAIAGEAAASGIASIVPTVPVSPTQ
jgi:hypothetical protein